MQKMKGAKTIHRYVVLANEGAEPASIDTPTKMLNILVSVRGLFEAETEHTSTHLYLLPPPPPTR